MEAFKRDLKSVEFIKTSSRGEDGGFQAGLEISCVVGLNVLCRSSMDSFQ